MDKCPECGSHETKFDQNEVVCRNCGLIIEDTIFEDPTTISEVLAGRAGLPGLVVAGGAGVDGRIVKSSWLYSTKEKNLRDAKRKIQELCVRFSLPKVVVSEAQLLFKTAVEKELNRGRDNLSFVYGSVYCACNMHGFPKTPLELTAFSPVSKKAMMKAYKTLLRSLNLRIQPQNPADMLPRFGSRLGLKPKTIALATDIIEKLKGTQATTGKHPSTIVATALYLASKKNKEQITQRRVANATGVIEVTLRLRTKEIEALLS